MNNMGFFSKVFGPPTSGIEKVLQDTYVPILQMMGMTPSEAKNTFRDFLKQTKQESKQEGTDNLPDNFGDVLLQQASKDEAAKTMLAKRRKEGATDEDIRWWWNMHELERRMMTKVDDVSKLATFIRCQEEGMNAEQAAQEVRKFHVMYGDPDDTSHAIGDDRPLPEELKDRINRYIEKRSLTDIEQCKMDVKGTTSMNALIRREIREGNL